MLIRYLQMYRNYTICLITISIVIVLPFASVFIAHVNKLSQLTNEEIWNIFSRSPSVSWSSRSIVVDGRSTFRDINRERQPGSTEHRHVDLIVKRFGLLSEKRNGNCFRWRNREICDNEESRRYMGKRGATPLCLFRSGEESVLGNSQLNVGIIYRGK